MSNITYFKGREMARFWRFRNIPYTDFTFISSRCKEIWSKPIKFQSANLKIRFMRKIYQIHRKNQNMSTKRTEACKNSEVVKLTGPLCLDRFPTRALSIASEPFLLPKKGQKQNYIRSRLQDQKNHAFTQSKNS